MRLREQHAHARAARPHAAVRVEAGVLATWPSAGPSAGRPRRPPRSRRCGACGRSGRPGCPARRPASRPCRRHRLAERRRRRLRSPRPPRSRRHPRRRPRPRALVLGLGLALLALLADQLGLLLDLFRLLDLGGHDDRGHDRLLGIVEEHDALGRGDLGEVHGRRDLHPGDVDRDVVGNGGGQRLDVELVRDLLHHAALLDAGSLLGALDVDRHRRLDLLVEAHLEQVDVHDLAADRVKLLVLDDHGAGLALDLQVDQRGPVHEHLAQHAGVDLERRAVAVGAAVDHAGHDACAAQPAHGAAAVLGPVLDGKCGSLGVRHPARQCSGGSAGRPILTGGVPRRDDSSIPAGRVRRTAEVGSVLGTQGARYAGTRAANLARSPEAAAEALERRHLEAAERMVETLGPDEGRGDEDRPARLLHRHGVPAARVPRALPGAAGLAAHLGAADAVEEGGARAARGVGRAGGGAVRELRPGGRRRRPPSARCTAPCCRRPRGGGEDPVPRRGRGDPAPTCRTPA